MQDSLLGDANEKSTNGCWREKELAQIALEAKANSQELVARS
jgi:hypothetical protein